LILDLHIIPIFDKFIIYRPLKKLAFLGNQAMVDLVSRISSENNFPKNEIPEEINDFLSSIGFYSPDPAPPALMDNRVILPTSVALLMTGRCNLRCVYCYANGGEKENVDLNPEMAIAAINKVHKNAILKKQSSFEVTFHGGGEPMLAWNSLKIITSYVRTLRLPAKINMVSNGVWNDTQREWIANNIDGLTISIDGGEITQNNQRPFPSGKGSFNEVMETIRFLDHVRFLYHIRITTTPEYIQNLPDDVSFLSQNSNYRLIQVEPAFHSERGFHSNTTDPAYEQIFVDTVLNAYDTARSYQRGLFYSGARPWLITNTFCSAPLGECLTIDPHGNVVGCYEITDQDHQLANISTIGYFSHELDELNIIESKREEFTNFILHRKDVCQSCFCYWHCAGDCYTRGYSNTMDENLKPYTRCKINQDITKGLLLRYIAEGDGIYQG
jgi:uncharacterized protein